jgi:DNA-binding FrmR family transcriptional regulator
VATPSTEALLALLSGIEAEVRALQAGVGCRAPEESVLVRMQAIKRGLDRAAVALTLSALEGCCAEGATAAELARMKALFAMLCRLAPRA